MITRRNLLKGMAGAAAAAPILSILPTAARAACPDGPKRIIVMSYPMGILNPLWRPIGNGSSFTLPFCTAPLEPFRDRSLFISNVDNKVMRLEHRYTYGHPHKQESALTGTLLTSAFNGTNSVENVIDNETESGGAKSASIDTVVGQAASGTYSRRAVNLGIIGTETRSLRSDSRFFWEAEASAASMIINPGAALQEYLGGVVANNQVDPREAAARLRRGSVLDAVRAQFQDLRSGLDHRDRRRLDFHAEYIRQLEVDISSGGICQPPIGIPEGEAWHNGISMRESASVQIRLLAQSMACDVAPVGRLEFLHQQNPIFGIPEIDDPIAQGRAALNGDWGWHGLCHTNPIDPVTGRLSRPRVNVDSAVTEDMYSLHLRLGMRFFVQRFADLLAELDRFVEGPDGRTVLDNSLCVLASDMGDGQGHNPDKMGYILSGNLGPFRSGYHFNCANPDNPNGESLYDHTHVLTTIANAFCLRDENGDEVSRFGIEGFGSEGSLPVRA